MSLQHSSDTQHTTQQQQQQQQQACGSIIDAEGREIPITEQMIVKACEKLEAGRTDKAQEA